MRALACHLKLLSLVEFVRACRYRRGSGSLNRDTWTATNPQARVLAPFELLGFSMVGARSYVGGALSQTYFCVCTQ